MDPLQAVSLFRPVNGVDGVNAVGGGRKAAKTGMNPFAPQQKPDAYGQYDRAFEHGFGGAQYRDGVLIGQKLNIEI